MSTFAADSISANALLTTNVMVNRNSTVSGNQTVGGGLSVGGNATLSGPLGVTGTATLSNVTASGTLGVTGNTTLTSVSATGTLGVTGTTTLSNVTASGTLGVTGITSLSNVTLSGRIQGDLRVQGNVIQSFNSYTSFTDYWSGIWCIGDPSYHYHKIDPSPMFALVLQPNNSYDVYFLGVTRNPTSGIADVAISSLVNKWRKVPSISIGNGIVDTSLEKSITLNVPDLAAADLAANGSVNPITCYKRLDQLTADYAYNLVTSNTATGATASGINCSFMRRILNPTDVNYITDDTWFKSYLAQFSEEIIDKKTGIRCFEDVAGIWDHLKTDDINSMITITNFVNPITGVKTQMNKSRLNLFDMLNDHERLKTDVLTQTLPVLSTKYATEYNTNSKLIIEYPWKNQYKVDKFGIFNEYTLSNVINDIPINFKYLSSRTERSSYNVGKPNFEVENASNCFVGLRMPLKVEDNVEMSFKLNGTSLCSNIIVQSGYYYPHSLAAEITRQMQLSNFDARFDFYSAIVLMSSFKNASEFYYVTVDSASNIATQTVIINASNVSFLTNTLGFTDGATVTCSFNGTFNNIVAGTSEIGNFPKYTFKGGNPTNFYKNQGAVTLPAGTTISTSFGNILTSTNPRDLYSGVDYFLRHMTETHSQTIMYLLNDFNQELYVPETWPELIYKVDDLWARIYQFTYWVDRCGGKDTLNHSLSYGKFPTLSSSGIATYDGYNGGNFSNNPNIAKVYSPIVVSNIMATNNVGTTYTNYLVTPQTIVQRRSDSVWLNITVSSFSNTTYAASVFGENIIGQIKPSVVSNLMGTSITSNVGYFMLSTCKVNDDVFAPTQLMVDYFTSIQAKYIVYDLRVNVGGNASWAIIPFGAAGQTNRSTYRNNIYSPDLQQFKSKTLPAITNLDFFGDVAKNPSKWPASFQTTLTSVAPDGSQLYLTDYINGGNVNVNTIKTLCPSGLASIVYNGDSITPGRGLNLCFLYSAYSLSAARNIQHMYLRQWGTSNSLGSNTFFSVYGSDISSFGASITTASMPSDLLIDNGDALTNQPFRFIKGSNPQLRIDSNVALSGTYINKNYHKHDGISDHDIEASLSEMGAEGRTAYGVTFTNSATWRDFRLERAVQQAILGPAPTPTSAFMMSGLNPISTTNPLIATSSSPFAWV